MTEATGWIEKRLEAGGTVAGRVKRALAGRGLGGGRVIADGVGMGRERGGPGSLRDGL